MKVLKRDGRLVDYESDKVIKAISKAMSEVHGIIDIKCASEIELKVQDMVGDTGTSHVEDIQDLIELELMKSYPKTAKAYILYRAKRNELRKSMWDMTELQRDIYNKKYRFSGETFDEFIVRVSGGNSELANLIRNQDFLFGGRILAGRGLNRNVTYSNCYVLPQPEDNLESIFDVAKFMGRTYSYGGGVGTDLSLLRPKGSKVNNAALTTSGPVSFMDLYDTTTAVIGQRGRRGALMLSMSTDHPDINEFITSKSDTDKLNHANISVRSNDDFFKLDSPGKEKTLRLIAENNWNTGEPGMLFWDRVEDWHLLSEHPSYVMTSTNPCGEQPLPAFGNCLLGSINLSNFVLHPHTSNARIDFVRLVGAIKVAITGLNEVLHEGIPLHPLKEQQETANNFRQIGLGILGLADMFIKLGIKYGSSESIEISHELGKVFRDESIKQSIELVDDFGTYPMYDYKFISKSNYFKALPKSIQESIKLKGMANSHVLSIAPTGSISTLIGVSGGIEPIFANSYTRTTKSLSGEGDSDYKVYTGVIEDLMNLREIDSETNLPDYCVTSHEINPLDRVKLQGVWQQYIDSAISSTVNLEEEATIEDIEKVYVEAHREGLKGITVFRDNCFRVGILNADTPKKVDKHLCPECGGEIVMAEGCNSCKECGWGQCSI